MGYVPFYSPGDLGETAFIESLLKANGVRYIIQNDIASRVQAGLSLNQVAFYVHPDDLARAEGLLKDFHAPESRPGHKHGKKKKKGRKSRASAGHLEQRFGKRGYAIAVVSILMLYVLYNLFKG